MLKLKLLAGCLLACSLCCWTVGCGGAGTIDTAPPVDLPDDDGDPATEGADPDTDDGGDSPEGTE
jgi:hypothetical protein